MLLFATEVIFIAAPVKFNAIESGVTVKLPKLLLTAEPWKTRRKVAIIRIDNPTATLILPLRDIQPLANANTNPEPY